MLFRYLIPVLFVTHPCLADQPQLDLPLECELGETCFVQQYMDLDDTEGVRDFGCGAATYDGHQGTDFRVPTLTDLKDGVDVIASAGGRVIGVRNTMADKLVKTDEDRAAIKGKECGNGAVIDHGGGWHTQYCHLKMGSVTVRQGQMVKKGDVLGLIGLSGQTQFPHVHLSVRKDGKRIDPFQDPEAIEMCGKLSDNSLWNPDLADKLAYKPTQIINLGIADQTIDISDIEAKKFATYRPERTADALVAFVRAINLVQGDAIRMEFSSPKGPIIEKTFDAVPRNKATQMYYSGKKQPRGGWAGGEYTVVAQVIRGGKVIEEMDLSVRSAR